jgi:hypothetical protein
LEMLKSVRVEEAVGMVLCQDVTRIVPGEFKGRAFKKGHIISKEDVSELLKLGKEHIYVWQSAPGDVHEDDAAVISLSVPPNIHVVAAATPTPAQIAAPQALPRRPINSLA